MLTIIPYNSVYKSDFKRLNIAWIEKYFKVEAEDLAQLNDPEGYIIDKGGHIFLAKIDDQIVGTCGLIKESDDVWELIKMSVDEAFQGQKIGLKLGEHTVNFAKQMGGRMMWLESNTILTPAITLYKKLGFVAIPPRPTPFDRCNILMELNL
jgi:putative acetyltransferase